ncbi:C40 family peptidase [Planomicrobium sp. CPCC 101110]|uniref:C40 family peptidase n=1 Tax=Planomicrobium sp. CPCC 101110 TaxID=2599619 RepID=UPI0011B387EE|nr:SH3 domain-containing C40 family peptidase [Planomicrobium sp. CPCC 101110]TWT27702.1 NlpC/P60 family protein [Planomicrobium sp. CPCC 101110]
MKKLVFSILAAGSLILSNSATDAEAAINSTSNANTAIAYTNTVNSQDVEQVASSKAVAISGTYKFKYNTNVRQDAGTKYKVVTVGKKGATAKATYKKTVGGKTWFKVKTGTKTGWVLSSLVSKSSTVKTVSSSSSLDSKVVSVGLSLKGIPYKFGGTTPAGFDCSGFIQYVFKQAGKSVSRTTLTQYAETKAVSSPQPGDLVFFANTYRPGISHVGIYIGNNQFVHSGGSKAEVISLDNSYWGPKFHSFRSF